MEQRMVKTWPSFASILILVLGCGSSNSNASNAPINCKANTTEGCSNHQVCEETISGSSACFDPISIVGQVSNAMSGTSVSGALVVARDANGAAVSGTATTDDQGRYSLVVPVKRDANGNPVADLAYTLRADASQYQSFPTAPRIALPILVSQPESGVINTAATDIALLPLPTTTSSGTITGTIEIDNPAGTLVVAGGATALAAADGTFTIFNVPAGDVTVTAYRQGFNLETAAVTVTTDATIKDVTITATSKPASKVSGDVQIVNPGDGKATSVILVVADTFVPNVARGESPPGLRIGDVTGAFSFTGVPDGTYVVLAAFENDFLVRDPDTCISGTDIVTLTVAGGDMTIDQSFKVTGALDVVSPDGEQVVSGTPSFVWADDSSEDHYTVAVYDALGTLIWQDTAVPSVSGNKHVTVAYAGPALTPGMIYQYRAASIRKDNCPISQTEDLRGVFRIQ